MIYQKGKQISKICNNTDWNRGTLNRLFTLVLYITVIARHVLNREQRRNIDMSILGNILWFICGGLLSGLSWVLAGCLWCISIIGIPIGLQCFKFAGLALFPFGKEVVYGGGAVSLIANIIWLIVSGIPMAVGNAVAGLICCITIIGIPFGKQFFKIAKLSLMPFGAEVI